MAATLIALLSLTAPAWATGVDFTDDPIVLTPQYGNNPRFGTWIMGVGDSDGDGYDDVLVCSNFAHQRTVDDIEVTLFFGGPDGPSDADHRVLGGYEMGSSCLPAGDEDGDGLMDMVVLWTDTSGGGYGYGEIHYGDGTSGSLGSVDIDSTWWPMTQAGDLDGDGLLDGVNTSGPRSDTTGDSYAYVHYGRNSWRFDSSDNPSWTTRQTDTEKYNQVGFAGDLDNDGYDDLAVMVQHDYDAGRSQDELLILLGSSGRMSIGASMGAGTRGTGDRMDGGEDFDGDGIEDMVFGARPTEYDGNWADDAGGAVVVLGSGDSSVIGGTIDITPSTSSLSYDTPVGRHVGFAGDVDRDGHADVFIGGPIVRTSGRESGIVFLAYGDTTRARSITSITSGNGDRWEVPVPTGESAQHEWGTSMEDIGDVNADGVNDIAIGWSQPNWSPVGAPYYYTNEPGEVRIWLGSCVDADGDAVCEYDDCDESDPSIPAETDAWYDGVDSDCDGWSDYDADRDGSDSAEHGGDDCDDTDDEIRPDADEIWYDGVDMDCDGWSDYDADLDGFDSAEHGGEDCDDDDDAIHPSATETWYDGVDQNCDGADDFDADGDGFTSAEHEGEDCDDSDAEINPDAADFPDDGVDSNCDGEDDYSGGAEDSGESDDDDDDDDDEKGGCTSAPLAPALSLAGLAAAGLLRRRED